MVIPAANSADNKERGDRVVMIDHSIKTYARLQRMHPKAKLSAGEALKFESTMARSYTDDADLGRGALMAPRSHYRPGQRDDTVSPGFAGMIPAF